MKTLLIVLACLLSTVSTFSQSPLFAAKEKGKLYGYIDDKGTYVIPPIYKDAGFFSKDAAVVKLGSKYGLIDRKGKLIVPATYEKAILYAPEGKFTLMKGGKWGVIDETGKTIIPFKYEMLSVFKNGYVVGGRILTYRYFKNKVCPFVLNEKADTVFMQEDCSDDPLLLQGSVNKKKDYASETWWPMVREGRLMLSKSAYVQEGGEPEPVVFVTMNNDGQFLVTSEIADNYAGFREGVLAIAAKSEDGTPSGKYIDSTGVGTTYYMEENAYSSKFPPNLTGVHPFFNGVAAAEKDGKWVFIDHDGWSVAETSLSVEEYRAPPPMYYNGLIGFFNKADKVGYVDVTGKTVIPFEYEQYHPFEFDVTPVKYKGLYGLLKKDGTWAVPPKFEDLSISPCPCLQ